MCSCIYKMFFNITMKYEILKNTLYIENLKDCHINDLR